jgi:hypothetical protein
MRVWTCGVATTTEPGHARMRACARPTACCFAWRCSCCLGSAPRPLPPPPACLLAAGAAEGAEVEAGGAAEAAEAAGREGTGPV